MFDRDSRLVKTNRQLVKRERMGRGRRGPWRLRASQNGGGWRAGRGGRVTAGDGPGGAGRGGAGW